MALIVDPDDLNQSTEVTFDTAAKTIALSQAGNLSTDGVTLKALYSFCKEEWKNDANLIRHPFPFTPITDEQFELKDGWDFANDASRYLIRTGGWAVVDTNGVTQEMWAGIITLGSSKLVPSRTCTDCWYCYQLPAGWCCKPGRQDFHQRWY